MAQALSRRQFGIGSVSLLSAALAGNLHAEPRGPASVPVTTSDGKTARKTLPRGCVIPGTGPRLSKTGDNFEDEKWVYYPQFPKSSYNIDEEVRAPGGISQNSQWVEGAKRGTPDVVKRVKTPPDGPPESKGAMLMQTLHSGIPGSPTDQVNQDDLLHNVQAKVGRIIPTAWSPNCTCRVYVPAVSQWERRLGPTFGFRTGMYGYSQDGENEEYWPGIFLEQNVHTVKGVKKERVIAVMRGDNWGRDIPSIGFAPETWCTLGMSFTGDGQCHFFARAGVEDLTDQDHIGSYVSYGYRAHTFETMFFNVINNDNGRTWSTPWVIDNVLLHVATPPQRPATAQQGKPNAVR